MLELFYKKWGNDMKKFLSCIILVLVIFLAGCGAEKNSEVETNFFCVLNDDGGREIKLAKKPERIVVTSASFLEPLNSVGGEIVGRPSSKTKLPDFAKNAVDIGPVYQIDTEKLLSCQPDLVIVNKGMNERLGEVLESNSIPYLVLEMKDFDSVKRNLKIFAQIVGQPERGEKIISEMDGEIDNILKKLPKDEKKVAVIHSTAQGLSVQLDNSIAGNVIKILGWKNVASGMTAIKDGGDTAPYSLEILIEQNPEIIFVTSMGNIDEIKSNMEKIIADNDAWQTIPAIKNSKLYFLPQDLFLLSPGIHYPEAVRYVAKLIYSEVEF